MVKENSYFVRKPVQSEIGVGYGHNRLTRVYSVKVIHKLND